MSTFNAARRAELKDVAKMAGYQGKFLVEYLEALEEIARAAAAPPAGDVVAALHRLETALDRVEWMNEERTP